MKRYRHPSDTEFRRYPLSYVILEAVRHALEKCGYPDSSRQYAARQRACQLRQARRLKAAPYLSQYPKDRR